MRIAIDERDPRPLYLQIVDEVRRARVLGMVGAGEALPSVRRLAAELRVNPNTVQQAYRELEREGVVYVRRGQGTYLAEAGADATDRAALARGVAERAMLEAHRAGIGAVELIGAIREVARARHQPG